MRTARWLQAAIRDWKGGTVGAIHWQQYSKSCFCYTCGLCHCVHVDVVVRGSHHDRPRHIPWCLDQSSDETIRLEHGEVNGGCESDHYRAADARVSIVDVSEGDVGETRFCIR